MGETEQAGQRTRSERLAEIRRQIKSGEYPTDEQIDVTAEQLLADLRLRREIGRTRCDCQASTIATAIIVFVCFALLALIAMGGCYVG
jgi:hypothetical protein